MSNRTLALLIGATFCAAVSLGTATAAEAALDIKNGCDSELTAADRATLEDAADWLDENRDLILDEIERDRAGADVYGYEEIDATTFASWSDELDEMLAGGIDINCHYDGSTLNRCTNDAPNDGTLGYTCANDFFCDTLDLFDQIHMCPDNIRWAQTVNGANTTELALWVATLAHELMHHEDGSEDHGPDGATDPRDPDSMAETIGTAAENVILSGQLDPASRGRELAASTGTLHAVDVSYQVYNENTHSGVGLIALSNVDRNPASQLCLLVDGAEVDSTTLAAIAGASSTAGTPLSFSVPAYDVAHETYEISLFADCNDAISETDEDDNLASFTFSTALDLAVEVELAEAPVLNHAYRADVAVPGWYDWFTLTYAAVVTNLDSELTSPPVDMHLIYNDMWTGDTYADTEQAVPSLAPGASTTLLFEVDVPTDAAGNGPTTPIDTHWRLDWDAESVHDSDLGNNYVGITIDTDYWQPDYRISSVESDGGPELTGFGIRPPLLGGAHGFGGLALTQELSAVVENFGPVAGEVGSILALTDSMGTRVQSAITAALGVRESSAALSVTAPYTICETEAYSLTADANLDIPENDEDNNTAAVTVGHSCPDLTGVLLPAEIELPIFIDVMEWYDPTATGYIETDIVRWHEEFIDWILAGQSNGPFLPDVWISQFDHRLTIFADHQWMLLSQANLPVLATGDMPETALAFDRRIITGTQLVDGYRPFFTEWAQGHELGSGAQFIDSPPASECLMASNARVSVKRLHQPGRQKLRVRASMPLQAGLNPLENGLALSLSGAASAPDTMVQLAAGAYERATKQGWKANRKGTTFLWKSKPALAGVSRVKVKLDAKRDLVHLQADLVDMATDLQSAGIAFGFRFDGEQAAPCTARSLAAEACAANRRGTSLLCR